mmetsp:Transcript_12362/g.26304  ORF Transcript_12362/g.26304 Transcript_12362/m.26304 type:complete len:130 (-) Transcript_12362:638-1027(-)
MDRLNVAAAGVTASAIGAFWYGAFAKQWIKASGVDPNKIGEGHPPLPYAVSLLGAMAASAMMKRVLGLCRISDPVQGMKMGLQVGAFVVLPWITNNILYGGKDRNLIWIDGGYPIVALGAVGYVLNFLG